MLFQQSCHSIALMSSFLSITNLTICLHKAALHQSTPSLEESYSACENSVVLGSFIKPEKIRKEKTWGQCLGCTLHIYIREPVTKYLHCIKGSVGSSA